MAGDDKKVDFDPSTGRTVSHKRVNQPYLTHQRWLAAQRRLEARAKARVEGRKLPPSEFDDEDASTEHHQIWGNMLLTSLFFAFMAVVIALSAGLFVQGDPLWGYRGKWTNVRTYLRVPQQEFTPDTLAHFDGTDPKRPILISVKGAVFDVSKGRLYYGPGGPYHVFAGRDASRAFVTGCFQTHKTHDTRGLTEQELQSLDGWYKYYMNHHTYYQVGQVKLPPIDPASALPEPCHNLQKPGM